MVAELAQQHDLRFQLGPEGRRGDETTAATAATAGTAVWQGCVEPFRKGLGAGVIGMQTVVG